MKRNWRTHYITFLANLILVIATGINLAVKNLVVSTPTETTAPLNPYIVLVAPIIAIIISSLLYFLDVKYFSADYPYKKFHFNKKWTKFYLAGVIIFAVNLFIIIILSLGGTINYGNVANNLVNVPEISREQVVIDANNLWTALLWAAFAASCTIGLAALGFVKYARFKIDVELLMSRERKTDVPSQLDSDNRSVVVDLETNPKNKDDVHKSKPKSDDPSAGLSSI